VLDLPCGLPERFVGDEGRVRQILMSALAKLRTPRLRKTLEPLIG